MKGFREEARGPITEFVIRNFGFDGKEKEEAIQYYFARLVGRKGDLVVILKEQEGFLGITKQGNIVDV